MSDEKKKRARFIILDEALSPMLAVWSGDDEVECKRVANAYQEQNPAAIVAVWEVKSKV